MLSAHLRTLARELSEATRMDGLANFNGEIYFADSMQPIQHKGIAQQITQSKDVFREAVRIRVVLPQSQDRVVFQKTIEHIKRLARRAGYYARAEHRILVGGVGVHGYRSLVITKIPRVIRGKQGALLDTKALAIGRGSDAFSPNAADGKLMMADNCLRMHQHPIPCRLREASFVIDGLMQHDTELDPRICYTDTHGFTEVVMATAALLGFDLAPRIEDIKDQVLYKMDRNQHYPHLDPILTGTVKTHAIVHAWDQVVWMIASLQQRIASPSLVT